MLFEDIKFFGGLVLVFIATFSGLIWLISLGEQYGCESYSEATGRDTGYNFPAGCFIQSEDGTWLSRDEYSAVITARQGLQSNHNEE